MGFSNLLLACRKSAAGISRKNFLRRMISTSTTVDPPWLMLPPAASEEGGAAYKLYSLTSKKVVSLKKKEPPPPSAEGLVKWVGSSHGWVATFNFENQHMFLSDPITSRHMKLPDIHTLPESFFSPHCRTIVEKMILSSSPADEDCRVVMTFGFRGMALCRPAAAEWTIAGDAFYEEFVYSRRRKRLFCITLNDDVECWDLSGSDPTMVWTVSFDDLEVVQSGDFEPSEEEARHMNNCSTHNRNLVFSEESDQLFLVTRHLLHNTGRDGSYSKPIYPPRDDHPYKTFAFDVYEIDRERGEARFMEGSLNGLAMFIGINHSFALPAAHFPELKADSIYFTDDKDFTPLDDCTDNSGGHDIGIFNNVDRNFSSVYYSSSPSHMTRIIPAPMWFTPTYI